ncbi:MAG: hypothetical protein KDD82_00810 [Planctomycetes bacterium]|nr:hypothetical protein [Planctomycetota bacterium]
MRPPLLSRLLLLSPRKVEANLARLSAAGVVERPPTLWQITLGVFRMWHRIAFRPETIGTCRAQTVRPTWRARLLAWRALRLPALLAEGAVVPWDLSGLLSGPDVLERHLLGAHHDGRQFVYDLEALAAHPGRLERLEQLAREVVEGDSPRARWLRDLVVFEGYHEQLLAAVRAARAGDWGVDPQEAEDPDITLSAYLRWCAQQPETPRDTWRAWRRGRLRFAPEQIASEVPA